MKSLSPAQRAQLRLYIMFGLAGAFNALLAILALLDQFKAISARDIIIAVLSQAALAIMEAVRHYYSAQGQPQVAAAIGLGENEIISRVAQPKYSANEQALQQSFNTIVNPLIDASAAAVAHPPIDPAQTVTTLPNIAAIKRA